MKSFHVAMCILLLMISAGLTPAGTSASPGKSIRPEVNGQETYRKILRFHRGDITRTLSLPHPQPPRKFPSEHLMPTATQPFLYLSWFPKGNALQAQEVVAYQTGLLMSRRVWQGDIMAAGGGANMPHDQVWFGTLQKLPLLPVGLSSPAAHSPLLVASQFTRGRWRTQYYDLRHLPAGCRPMFNALTELCDFNFALPPHTYGKKSSE